MTDAEKTGIPENTLTTYQAQACQAVRAWSVYITFYAVAVILVVVTFRSDQNGIQNLLLELAKDPAVWGLVLMPPLFMMFLRWSALELVTQLLGAKTDAKSESEIDSGLDQPSIEQAIFEDADSLTDAGAMIDTDLLAEPVASRESFDLYSLLQNMVNDRSTVAREKGIQFSLEIRDDVPVRFAGQPTVLANVLNELLDCALKHAGPCEIYVSAKVLEQAHGKMLLRFEVGDSGTGDGISREHLHHCRELLAPVSGQISEHHKEGQGHTVWFTIMLRKEHNKTAAA